MRFYGLALAMSAVVLGACGGGDQTDTIDTTPGATPATGAPAAGGDVGATAITGTTHEVRMYGDEQGYRFDPANITVAPGDGIRFINVNGGPHNVAFIPADIPDAVKPQLNANIPNRVGELSSVMVLNPEEEFIISFANIPAGRYPFTCTPHQAMNMNGVVTVQ